MEEKEEPGGYAGLDGKRFLLQQFHFHSPSEHTVDAMKLLPNDHTYYAYDGSFTTPPCTEKVKWVVLTTPVSLSKQQIERFRAVIKGNNRPVQPLNGRQVARSLPQ